ncbi:MAG TPA: thioredoxin domain-containing protein [Solirubrobacteraceae bacterium]|nr:thioredoxin domain-containing protein [Solirubrobacteraceae bacterium]
MASRQEQKEHARVQRLADEQAVAERAQRRRRLQILVGVIVIAVLVVVVAVAISAGANSSQKTSAGIATGTTEQQISSQVQGNLRGIPQNGTTLGNPKAKVTLTYFGDLECPVCRAFMLDVFPQFIQDQVRTGNVKVTYKSYCTATCGSEHSLQQDMELFNAQQVAAYAAGAQDRFWEFADLFYHEQEQEGTGYATDVYLTGIAKQIPGLDLAKWRVDRQDPALLAQVDGEVRLAEQERLPGTPALIMQGKKGEELVDNGNFPSYGDLAAAVRAVS